MLKLTDKVKQYNSFNKEFDFTYMFSDDHRVFNVGDGQFGKPTTSVTNTYEEAVKYYPEIWKENNVHN